MGSRYYTKRLRVKAERKKRRPARLKTFKSEEAAKKYAEAKKLKDYRLVNLRLDPKAKPKIKVVAK